LIAFPKFYKIIFINKIDRLRKINSFYLIFTFQSVNKNIAKMSKLLLLCFCGLILASCAADQKKSTAVESENKNDKKHYGLKEINADNAISADSLVLFLGQNKNLNEFEIEAGLKVQGIRTKIEGKIIDMCQMSGCWFNFETKSGDIITINMREHKETPKEWSGKTVVAEGIAYSELISIEELRRTAEAEGASRDELSKIKSPQTNYYLLADGAIEKN
jgi:hypothetical protein